MSAGQQGQRHSDRLSRSGSVEDSESSDGTEPNIQSAYSIETFAWDQDGNLLIKT